MSGAAVVQGRPGANRRQAGRTSALAALAFGVLASGCASQPTRVEVGRSVVVTEENRLSRAPMRRRACRSTATTPTPCTWPRSSCRPARIASTSPRTGAPAGSSRRGRSWLPSPTGAWSRGNPKNIRTELDQDSKGTIFYLFHAHDPAAGGARSILLGRSTDGGLSWKTSPVHVAPMGTEEMTELNWQAHIAIDPVNEQRIYVTWRRAFRSPWARRPGPPGRSWPSPRTAGPRSRRRSWWWTRARGSKGPDFIVRDGELFSFYRENPPAAGPGVAEPRLTTIVSSVSEDQGRTWKDVVVAGGRDASEPISIVDRERHVSYLVWHDNRNQDLDVFFSKSADGVTWSEPRQLNDDPKGTRIGQFYPKASLVPGGRIDVAWYDFRAGGAGQDR